jgi:hypothetical protein
MEDAMIVAIREVTRKGLQECFQKWNGHRQKCVTVEDTTSKVVCSKT